VLRLVKLRKRENKIMEKEKIEFACDIKLIKELLNTFGEEVSVTKLNAYTILVKMDVEETKFIKWAEKNIDLVTIVEPLSLRDKLPHKKLLGKILVDE
jgi:hypothetical protein